MTSAAPANDPGNHREVHDSELALVATRRAGRWRDVAAAGPACTAVGLEIVAVALAATADCSSAFAVQKVVAVFALALATVALPTLGGCIIEAALPKSARVG